MKTLQEVRSTLWSLDQTIVNSPRATTGELLVATVIREVRQSLEEVLGVLEPIARQDRFEPEMSLDEVLEKVQSVVD